MKGFSLFILGLFMMGIVAGFASADGSAAAAVSSFFSTGAQVTSAIVTGIQPIAQIIIGTPTSTAGIDSSTITIAQILLLLIVFCFVYSVLDSIDFFSDRTWAQVIISVAASILSVRFLSGDVISAILIPYQALGIALSAGLPFIIYFVFVEIKLKTYNSLLKKFLWILLGVIFLFIYFMRQADQTSPYIWIYLATALLTFFVALIEGTIQGWVARGRIESAHSDSKKRLVRGYKHELAKLDEQLSEKSIDYEEWKRDTARIKREIAELLS